MRILSRKMFARTAVLSAAALMMLGAAAGPAYGQGQTAERPGVSEPLRWNHLTLNAPIHGGCGEVGLELQINSATGQIEMFSLIMDGRPVRVPAAAYAALRFVQTEGLSVSITDGACAPDVEKESLSIIFVFGIPFTGNRNFEDDDVEFMMAEFVIKGRQRITRHITTVYHGDFTTEEVVEF